MKKTLLRVSAILLLSFQLTAALAQAPQKMSYQAVVRNASNALVTSSPVGMQITILQGSATGTPVYVETQAATTNTNGLVTIEIGNGIPVLGAFSSINWAMGPYFIMTETDPAGGTAYSITGTTQLMSVPYALYAETAGNGAVGATGATGATGADGINGTNGMDGATGATGADGITGANGANGLDGATGATGATGTDGINGTNGTNGATGATGADGIAGLNGTNGIDGATGATGAQGPIGMMGPMGMNGATGATGDPGPQGVAGTNGTNGATGSTGAQGPMGMMGPMGMNGATGATGDPGPQGVAGTNGTNGATGSTGAQGPMGMMGPMGMNGAPGAQGPQGVAGTNGTTGATGATGAQGPMGMMGPMGMNGAPGAQGPQGVAGTNGTNGATGATGADGALTAWSRTGNAGTVAGTNFIGTTDARDLVVKTNNIEKLRVTSGGRVGIGTSSPNTSLDVRTTDAVVIPAGTTAQRPSPVTAGGIRYNSDIGGIEYYDGTSWNSIMPSGTIIAFAGATVPAGWRLCDGSQISRTTYAKLFNAIGVAWGSGDGSTTFNLPDLRGRFLRGVDAGTGRDPDAGSRTETNTGGNVGDNVGSLQNYATGPHNHDYLDKDYYISAGYYPSIYYGTTNTYSGYMINGGFMGGDTWRTTAAGNGGNETRPMNVNVNYIIKQ